jgi:hypothetical protein
MIIEASALAAGSRLRARLVVIGAGPAGIVTALEAARRGEDVILVESGGEKPDPEHQTLSRAARRNADRHAPVELAVSRQIGGTSAIWGGRCVPYDPIDFRERPITADSPWPISYKEVEQYVQRACDWMKCGRAVFDVHEMPHLPTEMVPGLRDGEDVLSSTLERWSLPTNFGDVYRTELSDSRTLRLLTGATCIRICVEPGATRAHEIECRTLLGHSVHIEADDIVVACGGLESTRLLLASPGPSGESLGNHSGQLGHWYMAHLEGLVADIEFDTPPEATVYDYERDIDGVYVRRRFTFTEEFQLQEGLPNISAWIANPELADASHRDPRLSFTYLSLISPFGRLFAPDAQRLSLTGTNIPGTPYGMATRSPVRAHLLNLLRHPLQTLRFVAGFGVKRVLGRGRKPPGFFVYRPDNRYPLQYHAEHLPSHQSKVTLADEMDELGLPRLDIDIRFSDADVAGVLRAHQCLDEYLRRTGVGRLVYHGTDLAAMVRARSGGGFHQVGTTRMSADPEDGVVDENLTVHGMENVHVVSSSVFVTSGQANSTFLIVALALRLVDHLCEVD